MAPRPAKRSPAESDPETEAERRALRREELAMASLFLLLERRTRSRVDEVVSEASLTLAGLAAIGGAGPGRQGDGPLSAARLGAIKARGQTLATRLEQALIVQRREGRDAVRRHLLRRLGLDGRPVGKRAIVQAEIVSVRDQLAAEASADAIKATWTRAQLAIAEADTKVAMREAEAIVGRKVDLVVTTETGHMVNTEVARIVEAANGAEVETKDEWIKVWSAILDERTCEKCEALHGLVVRDEAPPLHPRCRCMLIPRRRRP